MVLVLIFTTKRKTPPLNKINSKFELLYFSRKQKRIITKWLKTIFLKNDIFLFYACFWACIWCIFSRNILNLRACLIFSNFTKNQCFNFSNSISKSDFMYFSKSARKPKVDKFRNVRFMLTVEHTVRAEIHQDFLNWEHYYIFLNLLNLANLAIFVKFQILFNPIWNHHDQKPRFLVM